MLKVAVLFAMATASLFATVPAGADQGDEATWHAYPCAVACWGSASYDACTDPPPPGTYDDVVTTAAPLPPAGRVTVLTVTIRPIGDWDLFVCAGPWGPMLSRAANVLGAPCDSALGPDSLVPVGCAETATIPVSHGRSVILRAVNFLGETELHGSYGYGGI